MGGGHRRQPEEEEGEEEEEEEALSLCDLPLVVVNKEDQKKQNSKAQTPPLEAGHEFEFGSWAGSVLTESENMCAAEDVFFQGQILPLSLSSVSSHENSSTGAHHHHHLQDHTTHINNPTISRCTSRSSDSLEHCSSSGFTSSSSRSSSCRSHNSSSSTTTTTTCSTTTYKPKVRNLFHSHPSPKPQIWFSGSRPKNPSARKRRSTVWGLFRPGLVQTPEIELQHYPNYKLSRKNNKSFSSSSSTSVKSNGCSSLVDYSTKKERVRGEMRHVFEGCKCSVDAIGTISSSVVIRKSSKILMKKNKKKKEEEEEKVDNGREIILKEEEKEKKEKKQRKDAMYYRRTFEWLKELSIGDDEIDDAYASRS